LDECWDDIEKYGARESEVEMRREGREGGDAVADSGAAVVADYYDWEGEWG